MTTRIAVVGAGIIGLGIAWRCAQRGLDVTVYDAGEDAASTVAAGMLAPTNEIQAGEEELQNILVDSAERWPGFAAELEKATGVELGYRDEGTLIVALTDDDLREVRRLAGWYERAGQPVHPLTARELREREPLLSPRVRGGVYAPQDRQVDPRRLRTALRRAVGADRIVPRKVTDLADVAADRVVVAAGVGTTTLTGLPVRPVKGQTVRLKAPAPPVRHVIRGYARSRPVYLVPRHDGELVIGATEEERGADTTVTAGGVLDLLRPAAELLPEVAEYPVTEILAGLRPGTPDNAPILGVLDGSRHGGRRVGRGDGVIVAAGHSDVIVAAGHSDVIVAAGHYRNGVLLTPVTADLVADLVATGVPPQELKPFTPDREALWT